MADGASDPVSPAVAAKRAAWSRQHGALDAPAYRLTLKSRRDDLKSFNHGKGKGPDGGERFYSAAEVERLLPYLSRQNARGYDVYVTPIDPAQHYIVVDDMHGDALQRLKSAGYAPSLIQESSADNCQAIIKTPRREGEQSEANALVVELNREFGDPNFSGVVHPFRLAGFSNKKPGKANAFTRIIEAAGGMCQRAAARLDAIRQAMAEAREDRARQAERDARTRSITAAPEGAPSTNGALRYQQLARQAQGLAAAKGWQEDWSRIDWRVSKAMLSEGWKPDQVRDSILTASPGVYDRHNDPNDYAARTVGNAMNEPEVQARRQELAEERERQAQRRRPGGPTL